MKFRTRLVLAISLTTALTFGSAFGAVWRVVTRSEERELDETLREASRDELRELAQQRGATLRLSAIDGPPGDDAAPLERFAALYAQDRLVDATRATCAPRPTPPPDHASFLMRCGKTNLQALASTIPGRSPDHVLLIALPRTNLEADESLLGQTLAIALAIAVGAATGVTFVVVRRLTLQHDAIADAARQVAAGNLHARAPLVSGDAELAQLTTDINVMIDRLGTLVASQKRFIAHAAHELRSPLTALLGELSLATRRERTAEEYKLAIDEALDATRRLKLLTEDLLALARLGTDAAPEPETVALAALLREAVASAGAAATERGIAVTTAIDDVTLTARPRDLVRLSKNLLDNAVGHAASRVNVTCREVGGAEVEIAVEDDGPGVPDEERARIFEPFYRSAEDRAREEPGAGLGLSIVREIARAHGGDVSVERAELGGARFVARLRGGGRATNEGSRDAAG